MKSLDEKLGGTYTLGDDVMLYPDLVIGDKDPRPIGKWGRIHMKYLETEHPGLYERLILNGTLHKHLADANERAARISDRLIAQMAEQEGATESVKAENPLEWVGKMNSIRNRAEEIIMAKNHPSFIKIMRRYDPHGCASAVFSYMCFWQNIRNFE